MRKRVLGATGCALAVVAVVGAMIWRQARPDADRLLAAYDANPVSGGVEISAPFDEAVFPPESIPPTFRWEEASAEVRQWLVAFEFPDTGERLVFQSDTNAWAPPDDAWETIKLHAQDRMVKASVLGVRPGWPSRIVSAGTISLGVSRDEVGAPIFYREVNLPFAEAVKDPSRIRWRFGPVSSRERPPVVLENLPVCGNCHSFSADAKILGMDVDYGSDKGSYAILPVSKEMTLSPDRIITWTDYRREDKQLTRGLLSQVSPDGRYVVSTVKDESVFRDVDDLAFSQLFFPVQGILAVYDRQTGQFSALAGADDRAYVQSNPVWSPDGKWIVFARSKAHFLRRRSDERATLLTYEDCQEFIRREKLFPFDLYRIPFNDGKGGKAEPIEGASNNGLSNYFPKFSPDGKWIVFCRAKSFMLLQPDSELYLIPSDGGAARRLRCNTARMNSWHSWSPNGKWLVFSSKAFTPYTQLFLTHIDERGESTPPVLLEQFTSEDRAANIPEFVNAPPEAIGKIREQFLDDYSYSGIALVNLTSGDLERAEKACRQSLAINPKNPRALGYLGSLLAMRKEFGEAERCFQESLSQEPGAASVRFNFGVFLVRRGRKDEGLAQLRAAAKLDPDKFDVQCRLGMELLEAGQLAEAEEHLAHAARLRSNDPNAHFGLAQVLQRQGKDEEALAHYAAVVKQDPSAVPCLLGIASIYAESSQPKLRNGRAAVELAERACQRTAYQHPDALAVLAAAYAEAGQGANAVAVAERALTVATAQGQTDLAAKLRQRRDAYRAKSAGPTQP